MTEAAWLHGTGGGRSPRSASEATTESRGPGAPARRDRTALGTAIRGLAEADDLGSAAVLIAERAAWMLRAEHAVVLRADEDGGGLVTATFGDGAPPMDSTIALRGPIAACLRSGRPQEVRADGRAFAVAPVTVGGHTWGAVAADGLAARVGRHAGERLAPFADLVSLAAATHEARTHLASLAGTDPLTGLGNRRTFDGLLEVEAERADRHGDPLSLVMLDIDGFKSVNDRFGHQLGDRVLIEVGRRLVGIARRGEAVSRIGGEEFAWILPRTDAAGSMVAAARALDAISGAPFEAVGTLTISAGVCELAAAGSPEEMVRLADRMLYRAKAGGRNAVRCLVPDEELAGTG